MRVKELFNGNIALAYRDTSIPEAARAMREQHVGNLVVVEREEGYNRPIGIVTDRDLVVEVLAKEVPIEQLRIGDIMSDELATALEDDEVFDTLRRMRSLGIRRMPVINISGALTGIIALDDLLLMLADSMNDVVALMVRELGREIARRP